MDIGRRPIPRKLEGISTFGQLIDLHVRDKSDVGRPPGRSKAYSMELLREKLGLVGKGNERNRRPTDDEIDALIEHFRGMNRLTIPMARIIKFAIATAMRRIEAGDNAVDIGIYAAVLQALGLLQGPADLAAPGQDETGLVMAAPHQLGIAVQ